MVSIFFSKFSTLLANTSNSSLLVNFNLKTISSLFDFKIVIISFTISFEEIKPLLKSLANLSITNFEFFLYLFNK